MSNEESARQTVTLSPTLSIVAAANPGLQLPAKVVTGLSTGASTWHRGCITDMWYQESGDKLHAVAIDGFYLYASAVTNLNDFREQLERAQNFGMEVSFGICDNLMWMLHLYPCKCPCD